MRSRAGFGVIAALLVASPFFNFSVRAQEPPKTETKATVPDAKARGRETAAEPAKRVPVSAQKLPHDSTTEHSIELPGRSLKFQATAGSIAQRGSNDQVQAEIAYVAYTLAGADPKTRPVSFALNGGPGSSSAWLHLGLLGPWRLPLAGAAASPSSPPIPVPNAETWLDFTDLVFIDPAGTGYSHVERDGADAAALERRRSGRGPVQWSVNGDIQSLADFIEAWVAKAGRLASPHILVGESYAGFRLPRLASSLQTSQGVGVHALVIISPVLDFGALRGNRNQPLWTASVLPSLAAAALEAQGRSVDADALRDAETYAKGDYLIDLLRGVNDAAAVDRVVKRVSALTGLPAPVVAQYGGRLDGTIYRREANRGHGTASSPYDASVTGLDPDPTSLISRADDPFTTALRAPVTSAIRELYSNRLNWKTEATYHLANPDVIRGWQWGNSSTPPESLTQLRSALALDAKLRALVVHGYTDLVTPYFVTRLLLDQIPDYGGKGRLRQITYPGGHMFYSRDASRVRFRDDVRRMLSERLADNG